jgi:hypothetical protein
MRVEPIPHAYAADDRAEIEEARGHRRHAEDVPGVEHAHDERRQGDHQDEGKHDPRQMRGQPRLFGVETGCEQRHEFVRPDRAGHAQRTQDEDRQRRNLVGEPPGRRIAVAGNGLAEHRHESRG